jgi:hypothetical protein
MWCQTTAFALYLKGYFDSREHKENIVNNNIFKEYYQNNNNLFVHVRLGDIIQLNYFSPFEYYDKVLSSQNFDKGYISSDSIKHEICQKLIDKYKLEIFDSDVVKTIMFGSTCNYIVLSSGTFSWMIGLFSYYSEKIYYPKIIQKWHGDIFIFPEWNEISDF